MKKVISLMVATSIMLTMTITAFAAPVASSNAVGYGMGSGACGYGGGLGFSIMRDESRTIVNKDVFEQNLDKAIADGLIRTEDRAYFAEMYDYCSVNGGLMRGGRSCCGMRRGLQTPSNLYT